MTINFILPFLNKQPIGGFKIVYEYANRLVERGHIVNLIHPADYLEKNNLYFKIRNKVKYYYRKLTKTNNIGGWFKFNKGVKLVWIPLLRERYLPAADVNIATAWKTSKFLNSTKLSNSKKFYFIQSLETWDGPEQEVISTWKYPMKKIVIAKWLQKFAEDINENAIYIPNGFDFENYYLSKKPSLRNKYKILMMYHTTKLKGSIYALEAVMKLKTEFPDIDFSVFSAYKKPLDFPDWINYYYRPDTEMQRVLYNENSIFISPSLIEGFPLPPAEAMICGCALAASNIDGHKEYNIENKTCLFFDKESSEAIYNTVKKLLINDELRIRIAQEGNNYIKKFEWDKSVNKFEIEISK